MSRPLPAWTWQCSSYRIWAGQTCPTCSSSASSFSQCAHTHPHTHSYMLQIRKPDRPNVYNPSLLVLLSANVNTFRYRRQGENPPLTNQPECLKLKYDKSTWLSWQVLQWFYFIHLCFWGKKTGKWEHQYLVKMLRKWEWGESIKQTSKGFSPCPFFNSMLIYWNSKVFIFIKEQSVLWVHCITVQLLSREVEKKKSFVNMMSWRKKRKISVNLVRCCLT